MAYASSFDLEELESLLMSWVLREIDTPILKIKIKVWSDIELKLMN